MHEKEPEKKYVDMSGIDMWVTAFAESSHRSPSKSNGDTDNDDGFTEAIVPIIKQSVGMEYTGVDTNITLKTLLDHPEQYGCYYEKIFDYLQSIIETKHEIPHSQIPYQYACFYIAEMYQHGYGVPEWITKQQAEENAVKYYMIYEEMS